MLDDIDPATRALLERFGFDEQRFTELASRVARGELTLASNPVDGVVEPPEPGDIARLPEPGGPGYDDARTAGLEALHAGKVAAVVLAGGMATRFGGVVKGAVEAVDGRSFLEWKLGETERLASALGVKIPVALMTSFQTDEATRAHVAARGLSDAALVLPVRLASPRGRRVVVQRGRRSRLALRPRARRPRRGARRVRHAGRAARKTASRS